jgi:hypothetical protein
MASNLQLQRNITSILNANTPDDGEVWVDTLTKELVVGDGSKLGGYRPSLEDVELVVNIPTDFSTIGEAIQFYSRRHLTFGKRIKINLETGYEIQEELVFEFGDWSKFWITSDDAVVNVDQTTFPENGVFMDGTHASMPYLDTRIDFNGWGGIGVRGVQSSTFTCSSGSGCINVGDGTGPEPDLQGTGIRIIGSYFDITGSQFTGAGFRNVWVTQGSVLRCTGADFSDSALIGLFASRGAFVHGHGMTITNCGEHAVRAGRSYVSCRESDLSGATGSAIYAFEGSIVPARNCNLSGAGRYGVEAFQGGAWVDINGGQTDVSGCTLGGILASDGSTVVTSGGVTIDNSGGDAILCDASTVVATDINIDNAANDNIASVNGGKVSANGATLTNAGRNNAYAARGGEILLDTGTATGAATHNVRAQQGSKIVVQDATVTGAVTGDDLSCQTGSSIHANGTTTTNGTGSPAAADTNFTAFNTIESNNGIIWN